MSDEAIKYVIFAVILVVAILVTWFLAIAYRKNVAEAKLGKAEDKADRKSTRLNSSHRLESRMPSSA